MNNATAVFNFVQENMPENPSIEDYRNLLNDVCQQFYNDQPEMENIMSNLTEKNIQSLYGNTTADESLEAGMNVALDLCESIGYDITEINVNNTRETIQNWYENIFIDISEPRQSDGPVILQGTSLYNCLLVIKNNNNNDKKEEEEKEKDKDKKNNQECTLCMNNVKNVKIKGCDHEFCASCLLQLHYYIKCPLCKQDFSEIIKL